MEHLVSWLFSLEGFGAFLTCFATLMIFSFLYRDNPFYKFAEHVFVGTSTGYGIVLVYFQVLKPNLIERLFPSEDTVRLILLKAGELNPAEFATVPISAFTRLMEGEWIYYLFLILGLMMLLKVTKRFHWLSRWPLAYVIGAFAGIQIIQATQGSLIPQLEATMKDFSGQGEVVLALNQSGYLPDGEMDLRLENLASDMGEWQENYGDAAHSGSQDFRDYLLAGSSDLLAGAAFEGHPRNSIKSLRQQIWQLVDENPLEAWQCQVYGGRPLQDAFALAALGEEATVHELDLLREEGRLGETADSFLPTCFLNLDLDVWQSDLAYLFTRIRLESPGASAFFKTNSDGFSAPPTYFRPSGQVGLTELLKREALDDGVIQDFNQPLMQHLADSLFTRTNGRSVNPWEWSVPQLLDLKTRILEEGGSLSLQGTMEHRLNSLTESEQLMALQVWQSRLLEDMDRFRRVQIEAALKTMTHSKLYLPFSQDQQLSFRANPADFLKNPDYDVKSLKWRMIVEIISNFLVVIGVCAGIFYFFFSKKHTGALGVVSKVGIAFLMMSFGASFGYTVMGRISLAIGRFQDLMAFPWMAGTALIVLVVALIFEARRLKA